LIHDASCHQQVMKDLMETYVNYFDEQQERPLYSGRTRTVVRTVTVTKLLIKLRLVSYIIDEYTEWIRLRSRSQPECQLRIASALVAADSRSLHKYCQLLIETDHLPMTQTNEQHERHDDQSPRGRGKHVYFRRGNFCLLCLI